ncbi:MAG: hydrogenase expression/formation protein HypE [Candidatus Omnitrophica bacterium]|jgi:hydrogenase expression/formation protein HypE|nr:hydrogenase expression/formation protein HypE [Candidatus Omnitrophota bacterium]MDD5079638.1 hydrogenase expression/formation protein HypE [Candidatus Omnitrophota bacterium]
MEERILLGHGSGGKLSHRLLKEVVFPCFSNPILDKADDAAIFDCKGRLAFTTDSFVVHPLFFPGGDIGKLAVCGTVNDLAVMAAKPLYLTAACIVEEGFEISLLKKVIRSMAEAAKLAGVEIIGGDFKVVEKNSCDGIFINTTGIGMVDAKVKVSGNNAKAGDAIIINGNIGEHGAAVMSARQDYKLETNIKSDCAALNHLIACILKTSSKVHVMRDPTRGGVATTLNEVALQSGVRIQVDEDSLPIPEAVKGVCELLGIDPLYMANEGKVLVFAPGSESKKILSAMRKNPLGKNSRIIGEVIKKDTPLVLLRTAIGSTRILDMLTGEQLPRIC